MTVHEPILALEAAQVQPSLCDIGFVIGDGVAGFSIQLTGTYTQAGADFVF